MADNTNKAVNMAWMTMAAAEKLIAALDELAALETLRGRSFIDLTTFDAAYAAEPGISHLTGNTLVNVLATSTPAIRTFMADNFHEDNYQQARSGRQE
jgi:hypothetical protein